MNGPEFERPSVNLIERIGRASSATITTILGRKNIRDIWMPIKPLIRGMKAVGPALTIRTVPHRDDIGHSISYDKVNLYPGHPDDAIDTIQPGDVVVLDGRGITFCGLFGDLLTARIAELGANALVSDMAVRDSPHMEEKGIPIFCLGTASRGGNVYNVDYNVPIGCAGALVCPGDIMLGDGDGVVVIPRALADEVADEVDVFEDREEFIRLMLAEGHSQRGLYPMGPEWEERFQAWRAKQVKSTTPQ